MKTILLTGATDGIGRVAAGLLAGMGHRLLLHGRSAEKLARAESEIKAEHEGALVETYVADFSDLSDVKALAGEVAAVHDHIDAIINNAGVLNTQQTTTADGLDIRFVVNTLAPYVLTETLADTLAETSRVVNVSSAAQAPVDLDALAGRVQLGDMEAYSQSKLAITMWSRYAAQSAPAGPVYLAVNPGSLLGSKMVKEAFGVPGGDLRIGADILIRAAIADEFADASGQYYDNDQQRLAEPHPDALDEAKNKRLVDALRDLTADLE